jgi:hypothetical protein
LSAPATDKWQAWQLSHSKCFPLVLANTRDEPTLGRAEANKPKN